MSSDRTDSASVMGILIGAVLVGLIRGVVGWVILWFLLGWMLRAVGLDLLERLLWPAPGWMVFGAIGAVIGTIGGAFHGGRRLRHDDDLAELAATMRLEYEPGRRRKRLIALTGGLPALQDAKAIHDRFYGTRDGVSIQVFNVLCVRRSTDGESTYTHVTMRTVAVTQAPGVPDLEFAPRSPVGQLLGPAIGLVGMSFDPDAVDSADASEAVRAFRRSWCVTVHGMEETMGLPDALDLPDAPEIVQGEARLRALLTPGVMAKLRRYAGWSVQVWSGRIALWRGDAYLPADKRPEWLDEALGLRRELVEAAAHPSGEPPVPPRPGETARQARVAFGATIVGLPGFFLGFLFGFAGASDLFVGWGVPGAAGKIALGAAIGFGSSILGGVLGMVIGGALGALLPSRRSRG
jgi:hypothetical protein